MMSAGVSVNLAAECGVCVSLCVWCVCIISSPEQLGLYPLEILQGSGAPISVCQFQNAPIDSQL